MAFGLRRLDENDFQRFGVPADIARLLGPIANNGIEGFSAALYQDYNTGEDQFVVAFGGTDPPRTARGAADWIENFRQAFGNGSQQYVEAMRIADALIGLDQFNDGNIMATGHSLGGGMASAASMATGMLADTFNAAGMHAHTLNVALYPDSAARYNNSTAFVSAYHVDWDLLTTFQKWSVIDVPPALGYEISMDGPFDGQIFAGFSIALFSSGTGWGAVLGFLAGNSIYVYYSYRCHLDDAVMHGLLGEEITGYDF
jgi:hypothetical protein